LTGARLTSLPDDLRALRQHADVEADGADQGLVAEPEAHGEMDVIEAERVGAVDVTHVREEHQAEVRRDGRAQFEAGLPTAQTARVGFRAVRARRWVAALAHRLHAHGLLVTEVAGREATVGAGATAAQAIALRAQQRGDLVEILVGVTDEHDTQSDARGQHHVQRQRKIDACLGREAVVRPRRLQKAGRLVEAQRKEEAAARGARVVAQVDLCVLLEEQHGVVGAAHLVRGALQVPVQAAAQDQLSAEEGAADTQGGVHVVAKEALVGVGAQVPVAVHGQCGCATR
jgi:hypothetical protein